MAATSKSSSSSGRRPLAMGVSSHPLLFPIVLFLLASLLFGVHLFISASKCQDTFCLSDSFAYYVLLEKGPFPGLSYFNGGLLLMPLLMLAHLFLDSVWSIRVIFALLTSAFFIAMTLFLSRIGVRRSMAVLFALIAVASFWWARISFGFLKNELGLLVLLGLAVCLLDWQRKPTRANLVKTLALAFVLLLAHTSTFCFAVLSFIGWQLLVSLRARSRSSILLLGAYVAAFALIAAALAYLTHEESLLPSMPNPTLAIITFFLLLAFASIFLGFYLRSPPSDASPLLLSFGLTALALGASGLITPSWGWRFILDGWWAVNSLLALIICSPINLHPPLLRPSSFVRSLLEPAMLFLTLLTLAVPMLSGWYVVNDMGQSYTFSDIQSLGRIVSETRPAILVVPLSDDDLQYAARLTGFRGQILPTRCPAASNSAWFIGVDPRDTYSSLTPAVRASIWDSYARQLDGPIKKEGRFIFARCRA